MSRRYLLAAIVTLAIILAFSSRGGGLQAHPFEQQAAVTTCDELQVVFIVDQSASMSGSLRAATDPDGLRFAGPKEAIDILSSLRWQTYLTTTMRVAMVHFGDRAQTALPWTTLDISSDAQRKQLLDAIAPNLAPQPPLGNTNIKGAFEYASSLFDRVKPTVNGCPIRAVVALTDGQPSLPREGFDSVAHLNELIAYTKQYMPAPDHKIFVIGLDKNNEFWGQNKLFYEKITLDSGKVIRATSAAEIGAFMAKIFAPNGDVIAGLQRSGGDASFTCLGTGSGSGSGQMIQIPPYLQQVRISLIKAEKTLRLQVADENGQLIEPGRTDMSVVLEGLDQPIETLTVSKPRPGLWNLLTQLPQGSDLCLAYVLSFNSVGQVLEPAASDPLIQFKHVPLRVRLVDASGQPLPNYNDAKYALRMDASLVSAAKTQSVTLNAIGSNEEYGGLVTPLEAGVTVLRVKAATQNVDGSDYSVFERDLANFDVTPVKLVLSTTLQGTLPQYRPISLAFGLTAADQPVKLDLPVQISASVTYEGDTQLIALSQVPDADATYTAEIKPDKAGKHTLRYRAQVDTPAGPVVIADAAIPFDVFPTTRVRVQFVEPVGDRFEATDFLNRPTGLPLQVQLVDDQGKELSPSQIGVQNPSEVFTLTVLNEDKTDVSRRVRLAQTGRPGLFRLSTNDLGPGRYDITLSARGELDSRFVWEQQAWTRTLQGDISPLFFAFLTAAALVAGLTGLLLLWFANSFRHPLLGSIAVYREVPTDTGEVLRKYLIRQTLPRRNKAVLSPSPSERKIIRRLVVTCENDDQSKSKHARVKVQQSSGATSTLLLTPGLRAQVSGYFIVKDESPFSSISGADMAAGESDLPTRS